MIFHSLKLKKNQLFLPFLVLFICNISALYSNILEPYKKIKGTILEKKLINLAHKSIKLYLTEKKILVSNNKKINSWPGQPAGIFITIVKNNRVRSCVGNFYPKNNNFREAIIYTSVEVTYNDSRFLPLTTDELDEIKIIITVVGKKWTVNDPYLVDLMRYGLLIKKDSKSAALLPGEARTSNWGIKEILKKGNIDSLADAEFIVFETVTFDERYIK